MLINLFISLNIGNLRFRVSIVGIFPTFFTTRCKAVCDPGRYSWIHDVYNQLREYPEDLQDSLKTVERLVRALVLKGFEVRLIHALSPLGVWLSLRHRLGQGFYALANNQPIKINHDVEGVIEKIKKAALNHRKRRLRFKIA